MQVSKYDLNLSYVPNDKCNSKSAEIESLCMSNIFTSEELRNLSKKEASIMNHYTLTEVTVKILKERGKCFFD